MTHWVIFLSLQGSPGFMQCTGLVSCWKRRKKWRENRNQLIWFKSRESSISNRSISRPLKKRASAIYRHGRILIKIEAISTGVCLWPLHSPEVKSDCHLQLFPAGFWQAKLMGETQVCLMITWFLAVVYLTTVAKKKVVISRAARLATEIWVPRCVVSWGLPALKLNKEGFVQQGTAATHAVSICIFPGSSGTRSAKSDLKTPEVLRCQSHKFFARDLWKVRKCC